MSIPEDVIREKIKKQKEREKKENYYESKKKMKIPSTYLPITRDTRTKRFPPSVRLPIIESIHRLR